VLKFRGWDDEEAITHDPLRSVMMPLALKVISGCIHLCMQELENSLTDFHEICFGGYIM
jgi:hypothetical protein